MISRLSNPRKSRKSLILTDPLKLGLTVCCRVAILYPSPTLAARDWRSGISRRIAAINAVFLCVKISKHFIIMSGWIGRCKAGRFLEACTPTCSVRLHDWRHVAGTPFILGIPS